MRLILASGSPRRAALLRQIGLPFEVAAADVDETVAAGESPQDYVLRLARAKAAAVLGRVADSPAPVQPGPGVPVLVLGADTAVVAEGRILGKPEGRDDAVAWLLALSGRWHQVFTGIAVAGPAYAAAACVVTEVGFRRIEPWEAQAYWECGEGADKAGGYGIQGIGGIFAESIRGSYSGVVGLPLAETERLLREGGMNTWYWRSRSVDPVAEHG